MSEPTPDMHNLLRLFNKHDIEFLIAAGRPKDLPSLDELERLP